MSLSALDTTIVRYNIHDLRPSNQPTRDEHRKARAIAVALGLHLPKLLDYEQRVGFGDRRYSFRSLREVYPECPVRFAFEAISSLKCGSERGLSRFLRGGGPVAETFIQADNYFKLLRLEPKPTALIVPSTSGGFAIHECERFAGDHFARCVCRGNDAQNHVLFLHPFKDFLKIFRDRWRPTRWSEVQTSASETPEIVDVGSEVRRELRRTGISQKSLAEHCCVSSAFMSNLMSGKKRWPSDRIESALAWLSALPDAADAQREQGCAAPTSHRDLAANDA